MKTSYILVAAIQSSLLLFSTSSMAVPYQHQSLSAEALQEKLHEQQQQLAEIELQLAQLKNEQQQKSERNTYVEKNKTVSVDKNWQIKSYGSLLYKSQEIFRNTQDIDPERRDITDLERVVIEFKYQFDPKWQIELELEYEHGGTGSALEYDGFEEFGEFESEIEAGGEVLVEKLEVKYQFNDDFAIKFGRIFVPVGLGTELHKPDQYLTSERHWSESALIPQVWHETGINFTGQWQGFTGQALLTTGLNSEYFRTYKWVASGHQKRFEQINADDLAVTLRLDYGDLKSGSGLGFSYYTGNTTGNRNNTNKVDGNGKLSILGLHGTWRYQQWLVRGQFLYGELADSTAITLANKTTPGLQPGNFAQLGSEVESAFAEVAYNTQTLLGLSKPLHVFVAYDYANTMKVIEQGTPTERFNTQEFSFGLNYFPIENIVLKAQFSEQNHGQSNLGNTQSFSLSMGYNFSI